MQVLVAFYCVRKEALKHRLVYRWVCFISYGVDTKTYSKTQERVVERVKQVCATMSSSLVTRKREILLPIIPVTACHGYQKYDRQPWTLETTKVLAKGGIV